MLLEVGGEKIVLKDFRNKGRAARWLVGVLLTWREARVLRRLIGMDGVPQFRGRPDRCSVAMTYIPCRRMRSDDPALRGNERYVSQLEDLVTRMHRRGVVHLDLKHRTNLAVTPRGVPVVLDFGSGLCFNPASLSGRAGIALLGPVDRLAVLKWRSRLCPHTLTPRQRRVVLATGIIESIFMPGKLIHRLRRALRKRRSAARS